MLLKIDSSRNQLGHFYFDVSCHIDSLRIYIFNQLCNELLYLKYQLCKRNPTRFPKVQIWRGDWKFWKGPLGMEMLMTTGVHYFNCCIFANLRWSHSIHQTLLYIPREHKFKNNKINYVILFSILILNVIKANRNIFLNLKKKQQIKTTMCIH